MTQNLDSILFDRFGNSYDLGYFQGSGGIRNECGYFSLEFDGIPDSLKNTICQVFSDISDTIEQRINEASCGESIVPSNVDIYIGYNPNVKYPALAAGTPFYSIEGSVSCEELHLNMVYSKINGGKIFPGDSDGALYFNPSDTLSNSSDTLKWHIDLNSSPESDEFDLYSVVLHEALHMLAFESRMLSDGTAKSYFSLWDSFIHTVTEFHPDSSALTYRHLIVSNCVDNCWVMNDTTFSDSIAFQTASINNCSQSGNLDFVFGTGIAPILAGTPNPNAFSHLADSCNTHYTNYVMQPGIKRGAESERREITNPELEILCALGYKLNSCDECYMTASKEEAQYTNIDYYNTCCDPIFTGCIGDTLEVKFSELLCNDFTNGPDLEITGWDNSVSGVSISNTDTSLLFSSALQGTYLIQYTVGGCECRVINSILAVSFMPCVDCSTINTCQNLVCTEGFEEFSPLASKVGLISELGGGHYFVYDGGNGNTPDICTGNGNNYLHLAGSVGNPEGIALKLSHAIPPGCTLTLSMDGSYKQAPTHINLHASKYPPCSFLDTRISKECVSRDCGEYVYSPICVDTLQIEYGANGSGLCPNNPNLHPLTTKKWVNNTGDTVNYIIISPHIDESNTRNIFLDNVVITYDCIASCFNFEYVLDCYEVEFTPCQTDTAYTHFWDFGDGDTSTLSHPIHIYSTIDTFLVTHIVSDSCNQSDTVSLNVIVNGVTSECCPDTVLSTSTVWNESSIPNKGRFHTITVEQGVSLTIEDGTNVLFCEGGALIIQPGGYVDLEGILTSYGDMTWLGVFVEGDTSLGQHINLGGGGFNGLQQGMIFARNGSMIQNSKIGIRNYGPDGYSTCGGMIRCEGTSFINNTIGAEFGPYQNINSSGQPVPSLGSFRDCSFLATEDYFIQEPFFGFVRMRKADGMRFAGCDFKNELIPELASEVAEFGFGIHAVSSGFQVYAIGSTISTPLCESPCVVSDSTRFSGLGHGIYVMTQDKTRPYSVYQSRFENCCRGITSINSAGGTLLFNTFNLGNVPDTDFSYGQIGVDLYFDHSGFTIKENQFIGSEEGETIPIGLLCDALGEFDNEIRRNTFIGVETANQAFGNNADLTLDIERGLVYLCNTFDGTPSQGYDFHIPNTPKDDYIHPYQTSGSLQGSNISTGNHFAYSAQDFMNYGEGDINYWYYPPGENEEPRDSFLFNIEKDLGLINDCSSDFCVPPCIEDIDEFKEDFITHLEGYTNNLDDYLEALNSENQNKIDTTRSKALYYRRLSSRDAYTILQHLMIDTLEYHTDSLIRWMGHLDTYGAEVMIAGEYAAAGDIGSALDVLETIAGRRELSPSQETDLGNLLDIYYLLEVKPLHSFSAFDRSFLRDIANLNTGAASGVSRALLSYFGEYIPLPYYQGEQIQFRNVEQDSFHTFFSGENDTPLKVYPNPTSGDITIEWKYPEKACTFLMVYNFFGQKVLELNGENKSPFKLKTDDWKNGVHWIIVQDFEGSSYFGKVLIFRN